MNSSEPSTYRGRLAPSPTGLLHLGHARTFWIANERARAANGTLVLRNEDLDEQRSKPEFVAAFIEDLMWLGCEWQEGPDIGGPFAPYNQSKRVSNYRQTLIQLIEAGHVYACTCSRKDIQSSAGAPHGADDEIVYPGTCRANILAGNSAEAALLNPTAWGLEMNTRFSLRFRVPDNQSIEFNDGRFGSQSLVASRDFGDFVLWRHDDVPSYQIAVVTDDIAMQITEVVRGEDLLVSTARQLLIYEALGAVAPTFYHCPLVLDESGQRLAKRSDSLSLRSVRESGKSPEDVRAMWGA
jgi:glutamyl-tRNA synthetase